MLVWWLALCLSSVVATSCATPTAPTGGPRDTIGPQLIADETTPNFQTNFRPEEIVLTFDEWVELDRQQTILISPPIELGEENQPTLRRRSLVLPLQGIDLLDSVTYVVTGGSAVKDLNEGNPTENLRFVFSTGPVLDSASVSGTLVNDFTGKPLESATFTLFANLADTAFYSENPTYFAQTDEEGSFTVYNVKPGPYRGVALQRNPSARNYFFDLEGFAQPTAAGFVDTVIQVNDGENSLGPIRVSPVLQPVRVNAVDTSLNGAIRLTMNQDAELVDLSSAGDYLRRNEKDTLVLFYREYGRDTLFLGRNGERMDTVVLADRTPAGQRPIRIQTGASNRLFAPNGVRLSFDRPLDRIDTALVEVYRDTFPERLPVTYELDSLDAGRLTLRTELVSGSSYELAFLPGALTDWTGYTNPDTLHQRFTVGDPEAFGSLTLTLQNLDPTANYILRLVQNDKVRVATRRYIEKRFEYVAQYPGLGPGTYIMELIYDSNENRRYDSGDIFFGLQPEVVRRFDIEALRANWEVEQTIDLDAN